MAAHVAGFYPDCGMADDAHGPHPSRHRTGIAVGTISNPMIRVFLPLIFALKNFLDKHI